MDCTSSFLVIAAPLEDNLFKTLINTTDIVSCRIHSKVPMLDILMILKVRRNLGGMMIGDINSLDQFVRLNAAGDVEPSPDDNANFRDHNAWGDISNRFTRQSMTGIRGGEHVSLGHKFACGFLESNYYFPVRYAPLEIEVTLVSDQFTPIIQPVPTATATVQGGDRAGYYFTESDTSTH